MGKKNLSNLTLFGGVMGPAVATKRNAMIITISLKNKSDLKPFVVNFPLVAYQIPSELFISIKIRLRQSLSARLP